MLVSEICIKKPVFSIVINLLIVILGVIFFSKLQIRGIPDIDPPVVNITSLYYGADAVYMDKEVTTKIEKALKNVKNLDFISSTSESGISIISLSFKLNSNVEIAINDIRSKISSISPNLPQDMKPPLISKLDSENFPSIWLNISSDKHTDLELTKIIEDRIKLILEKQESVGQVLTYGAKHYSIKVEPDIISMFKYKTSPQDIDFAIRQRNKDYPLGVIKTKPRVFNLKLKSNLDNLDSLKNIALSFNHDLVVRVKDVSKVYLGPLEDDSILRFNGKRSVAIGVIKQSKSNIVQLSKVVQKEILKIKSIVPEGVNVQIIYDGATPIKASIKAVFHTIIEALLLVSLVTYLFLRSIKITLIPFIAIPISLIGTFSAMYLFNFSINTFTLLSMILAIGLVVDDAIVMLENIYKHYESGKSPKDAAILGSKEIGFTIFAITITLTSVFLPIGFVEGFVGKLFIEFAWTLAFCVLFSGFVAITLTPMMVSKALDKNVNISSWLLTFDSYIKILQEKYIDYLKAISINKKPFLLFSGCSIIILLLSIILVNKTFIPKEDDGFLQVLFNGPEGSSSIQSENVLIEAEKIFSNCKDISSFLEVINSNGSDNAFAFLILKDWGLRKNSQEQIKTKLSEELSRISGMSITVLSPPSLASSGVGHPIEFNLQTSLGYEEINKISKEILLKLQENPVFKNVERSFKSAIPTIEIDINYDKTRVYGVLLEDIGNTVQYWFSGKQIGDFRLGNDTYDIILQYPKEYRQKIEDFKRILVKQNTNLLKKHGNKMHNENQVIPLDVIASFKEKVAVKSHTHYNNLYSINFFADLNLGYKITQAVEEINRLVKQLIDPNTTKLEYLGEIQRMHESENSILKTFLLALIFIYLILAAQFESFIDPFIILLSVPFSITGGVLFLLLFNNTLNIYSNIGLVTLIGLITKNSIMIVEFANQLKMTNKFNVIEAVIHASNMRFRPIIMTSFATIFGAIPLVLSSGPGSAARNSIGLVIVGGMLLGTIFTMLVIPLLYQIFKRS